MTIDEAIKRVQPYVHPYCLCLQLTGEEAHQVSQAIMVLANTSQKYQTIEQIVNDEFKDLHPLDRNPYKISLIKEVVDRDAKNNSDN